MSSVDNFEYPAEPVPDYSVYSEYFGKSRPNQGGPSLVKLVSGPPEIPLPWEKPDSAKFAMVTNRRLFAMCVKFELGKKNGAGVATVKSCIESYDNYSECARRMMEACGEDSSPGWFERSLAELRTKAESWGGGFDETAKAELAEVIAVLDARIALSPA